MLEKDGLGENELGEITAVWEAEKHLIYKKILNQNSKSTPSFQGLHWSIRKGVAARSGVKSESSTININMVDKQANHKLSLSKEEFSKLAESVHAGTDFLNELFQS